MYEVICSAMDTDTSGSYLQRGEGTFILLPAVFLFCFLIPRCGEAEVLVSLSISTASCVPGRLEQLTGVMGQKTGKWPLKQNTKKLSNHVESYWQVLLRAAGKGRVQAEACVLH